MAETDNQSVPAPRFDPSRDPLKTIFDSALEAFGSAFVVWIMGGIAFSIAGGFAGGMVPSLPPGFGGPPSGPHHGWWRVVRGDAFGVFFAIFFVHSLWVAFHGRESGPGKRLERILSHLREHSAEGKARTLLGYQARRPAVQHYENEFSRLRIPVLLVVGDQDEPCMETTLWLKKTLPNAGLWICPDSGHAINLEEPAAFNRAVGEFLNAVEHKRWRC